MKLVAAASCALILALGACGSDDITVPTDKGDVSVSRDGNDVTIESEDGSVKGGSGKLPDGFPADEIPLVDGDILAAVAVDQTGTSGWSVSVLTDGSPAERHAEAVATLEAAGFTSEGTAQAGYAMAILSNGIYRVLVGSLPQDDEAVIQYTVEKLQ